MKITRTTTNKMTSAMHVSFNWGEPIKTIRNNASINGPDAANPRTTLKKIMIDKGT